MVGRKATVLTRKPREASEARPAQRSLLRSKTFRSPKAAGEVRAKDLVLGSPLTGLSCHGNNPVLAALLAPLNRLCLSLESLAFVLGGEKGRTVIRL